MPEFTFESTIAAPLEQVWAFHQNVRDALPALSPDDADVRIVSADEPLGLGSRIEMTVKGPMGRVRWVAKYVDFCPPHAVVFGQEARFVDEQESGPFKYWRHAHEFERIAEKTSRLVDHVTYRLPFGPIGWLADILLVRRRVKAMFAHRHAMTKQLLEKTTSVPTV